MTKQARKTIRTLTLFACQGGGFRFECLIARRVFGPVWRSQEEAEQIVHTLRLMGKDPRIISSQDLDYIHEHGVLQYVQQTGWFEDTKEYPLKAKTA